MASEEKVTVDKSYFDALLRRADFHTSAQILGRRNVANVTVSREEYDGLLRSAREYHSLKIQLFEGGLSQEALEILIAGAGNAEPHEADAGTAQSWTDGVPDTAYARGYSIGESDQTQPHARSSMDYGRGHHNFNTSVTGRGSGRHTLYDSGLPSMKTPASHHNLNHCPTTSYIPEDTFGDGDSMLDDDEPTEILDTGNQYDSTQRTLYFAGFPPRTTYQDLVSMIKGGKLLSITIRSEKSATVTFLDAAADFLTWVKRNDLYLHSKRIEVRWAERQFHLNNHIATKIANGATRNIRIRGARDRGLTEGGIREDMEHIHNLVIISIDFRNGDAFVSTNTVHNALFARACMMSRSTYKGCKIEFYPDDCDVPLPARSHRVKAEPEGPAGPKASLANRFDMLSVDSFGSESE